MITIRMIQRMLMRVQLRGRVFGYGNGREWTTVNVWVGRVSAT
jgi:hypothetical protein